MSNHVLRVFWPDVNHAREPACSSDVLTDNGVDILACLLMDDGGRGYESSVPWLEEGLARVRQVKSGAADCLDWSRDAWAVTLTLGQVILHSLYDERCNAMLELEEFESALKTWVAFISKR